MKWNDGKREMMGNDKWKRVCWKGLLNGNLKMTELEMKIDLENEIMILGIDFELKQNNV